MDDKGITPEQLQAELQPDVKVLAKQIAQAINAAKAGQIIADSEELVRDAHAEFRQKAYQRALDLLQNQGLHEAFSPSADRDAEQGQAADDPPDGQRADSRASNGLLVCRDRNGDSNGPLAGDCGSPLQSRRP